MLLNDSGTNIMPELLFVFSSSYSSCKLMDEGKQNTTLSDLFRVMTKIFKADFLLSLKKH